MQYLRCDGQWTYCVLPIMYFGFAPGLASARGTRTLVSFDETTHVVLSTWYGE